MLPSTGSQRVKTEGPNNSDPHSVTQLRSPDTCTEFSCQEGRLAGYGGTRVALPVDSGCSCSVRMRAMGALPLVHLLTWTHRLAALTHLPVSTAPLSLP